MRDPTFGGRLPPLGLGAAASPPVHVEVIEEEARDEEEQQPRKLTFPLSPQLTAQSFAGYTYLAWFSLGTLVLQNSALTLTMRASRLRRTGPTLYLASSAVVMCELLKLVGSTILLFGEQGGVAGFLHALRSDILANPIENNLPLIIPAGLYTLQNNLQYLAASNLDPALFQVLYQMKLVTTALLTVAILGRRLSTVQWSSVVLLAAGITLVQMSAQPASSSSSTAGNSFVGFLAVFAACWTSALAGVYLEKLVKQTKPSVWIRNMQMAFFGLVIGLAGAGYKDGKVIAEQGFLVGYDWMVWVVIALQSFGGMLTAVVVKHADNVVKGFATGLAIIVSCAVSTQLFGFVITTEYLQGAALVVISVYLYSVNKVPCWPASSTQKAVPSPRSSPHREDIEEGGIKLRQSPVMASHKK